MKPLHAGIALCCLAAALSGQEKEITGAEAKARIAKKVEAMRKAMREGKIREFNVYVKVWLKNGNRMRGVVKQGQFVELHDGLDFVSAAQIDDKRAGMRVWYSVGTNSYVFLRYEDINRYEIGSRLTDQQVKSIETKLEKELAETRANYRRIREANRKQLGEKGADDEKGSGPKEPGVPTLTKEQSKVLLDFPPASGWGEDKIQRLKQRRITLGVYPNEKEREFEKAFPEWKEAYEVYKKIEAAEKKKDGKEDAVDGEKRGGATPPPGTPPPPGTTPPPGSKPGK